MATSTPDIINPPKPLAGKYDARGSYKRTPETREKNSISTRKPEWAKHLSRNAAGVVLKQVGIKETCLQFLSATRFIPQGKDEPPLEVPDTQLRWQVFQYLWDRLEGKPFVAINPAAALAPSRVTDNRIQVAIGTLLASPTSKSLAASESDLAQAQAQSSALATVGHDATATSNNVTAEVTPATPVPSKRPRRAGGPK